MLPNNQNNDNYSVFASLKWISWLSLPAFLSVSTLTFALTDAEVTVSNLNVRKAPNGQLVEQLDKGQAVRVVKEKDGWSQILYLEADSESASYGWVSSQFLQIQFEAYSTVCTNGPELGEKYCLAVMEPNLQCRIDEETSNYSECKVTVRYELSTEAESMETAAVHCVANLDTRSGKNSEWDSAVKKSSLGFGGDSATISSGSIELNFEFTAEDPVSETRAGETECEIIFGAPIGA